MDQFDFLKDLLFLFGYIHSFKGQIILVLSIVAPPYILLATGAQFIDIYAIGDYNKRNNKFATLGMKILQNIPQMIMQLSETLSRGTKLSVLMGFTLIFGPVMLNLSIGWGVALVIKRKINCCNAMYLFMPLFGSLAALIWTQISLVNKYFISVEQAQKYIKMDFEKDFGPDLAHSVPIIMIIALVISIRIAIMVQSKY